MIWTYDETSEFTFPDIVHTLRNSPYCHEYPALLEMTHIAKNGIHCQICPILPKISQIARNSSHCQISPLLPEQWHKLAE